MTERSPRSRKRVPCVLYAAAVAKWNAAPVDTRGPRPVDPHSPTFGRAPVQRPFVPYGKARAS